MAKLGIDEDDDDAVRSPSESENVQVETTQGDAEPEVKVLEEDERIAHDDQDEDQPVHRNRESAKERRDRAKRAKHADKEELALLRTTIATQDKRMRDLEQGLVASRVSDIDSRINQLNIEADTFDRVFGAAITKNNGEDARDAARLRDEARTKSWQLSQHKTQIASDAKRPAPVPYADKANAFVNELKDDNGQVWYNPQSGDEDSLIVEAIDRALMTKMNPSTPQYWSELGRKVREKLPHRFDQQAQDVDDVDAEPAPRTRRGPPVGGGTRTASGGNLQEIRLPAAYVDALKDAGKWDDPKVRQRMARRYAESLSNNSNRG